MTLKNIKKIEIALFLCNLLLFYVVNFFMRKFHPVSVALMAIPVLIGLTSTDIKILRDKYKESQ